MEDFGGGADIGFDRIGRAGVVTLNRPKALNALTHGMVRALSRALDAWADDDAVAAVVVRAEGRAFCAGGDVTDVYERRDAALGFFADEYRLNRQIARFEKPYVALIDGIVMGGGVGISFHGSHRAMSERAQFAMPEVGLGFFPDVGGSFLLPRLPGSYGLFLGLTGKRIGQADALRAGLATHAVASADLDAVLQAICAGGDPDRALRRFAIRPAEAEEDEADRHMIAKLFSRADLSDVMLALNRASAQGHAVAAEALDAIAKASPTSVAVAFRQLTTGGMLELEDCMRMEYRITSRMLAGREFYEGIRAIVVDKDRRPQWSPARLEDVSEAAVAAYFAPLPGRELVL